MHLDLHVDPGAGQTTNAHTVMDLVQRQVPGSSCLLILPYAHKVKILDESEFQRHYRDVGGRFHAPGKHAVSAGKIVEAALQKMSAEFFWNISLIVFDESDTSSNYCAILKHLVRKHNEAGGKIRTIYMSGTRTGILVISASSYIVLGSGWNSIFC